MNQLPRIRWYRTVGFKLTTLLSVSILVFSIVTIYFIQRYDSKLFFAEYIDRKVKLTSTLDVSLKALVYAGAVPSIEIALSDFVDRNHDLAYACITGLKGVLLTTAEDGKCPAHGEEKDLQEYSTELLRVREVENADEDITYLEVEVFVDPEDPANGSLLLGYYLMNPVEAERFRKIMSIEQFVADSYKKKIKAFDYNFIDMSVKEISNADTHVRYIIVTDGQGRILAHPNKEMKFKQAKDAMSLKTEKTGPYNPFLIQYSRHGGEEVMDVSMGLFDGANRIGSIRIGYSLDEQRRREFIAARNLTVIIIVLVVIMLITSMIISRRLSKPLVILADVARRIGGGDLEAEAKYRTGGDELRLLYESFNQMIDGLKERDFVKDTFSRYVTKQVADEILKNPDHIEPGGTKRKVTILFSDIRGFTTFSEQHSPEEVISHLNEYFSGMVDVIFKYEGTLDKYIGDAIMAVYGSPIAHDDDPLRAAKTALEMRDRLEVLNQKWTSEGKPVLKTGIGINTGEVIVGNIGHARRMEYTVIGDSVNLASRIEGLTKDYDCPIIISEYTYLIIKDHVEVQPLKAVTVKGKTEPVEIFHLIRLK